jgi:quinol monooxygenase YgiN
MKYRLIPLSLELSPKTRRETSLLTEGAKLDAEACGRLLLWLAKASSGGAEMSVRLVVTITAAPGKGAELAQVMKARCEECMKEPGCEQFEIFQSALNPDKLALLERWSDQAALDTHAKLNSTRPALRPELRVGSGEREDYQYNRTR